MRLAASWPFKTSVISASSPNEYVDYHGKEIDAPLSSQFRSLPIHCGFCCGIDRRCLDSTDHRVSGAARAPTLLQGGFRPCDGRMAH